MLWRPELVPTTLVLDAAPDGFERARPVDPAAIAALIGDYLGADGRHVILADAKGEHRLWLRTPAFGTRLAMMVPLDDDFETRIAAMTRFYRRLTGRDAGWAPRGWPLTAYRRDRLTAMLRALDLRLGGASYREIAVVFGDAKAADLPATEWKMSASRSHVIRLVRDGMTMMNGGYRKLLRGR